MSNKIPQFQIQHVTVKPNQDKGDLMFAGKLHSFACDGQIEDFVARSGTEYGMHPPITKVSQLKPFFATEGPVAEAKERLGEVSVDGNTWIMGRDEETGQLKAENLYGEEEIWFGKDGQSATIYVTNRRFHSDGTPYFDQQIKAENRNGTITTLWESVQVSIGKEPS